MYNLTKKFIDSLFRIGFIENVVRYRTKYDSTLESAIVNVLLLHSWQSGTFHLISRDHSQLDDLYLTGYTCKNAQVATELQTSCNKSVQKLLTRCIRTACPKFVRTSLEQAVDKL